MSDEKNIFERKEAAEKLGIALSTLYKWEHTPNFPGVKRYPAFGGKKYYYTIADIQAIMDWRYGIEPVEANSANT